MSSSIAARQRTYAHRDSARSVDPGPILELQVTDDGDSDDEDEDEVGELGGAERVRRRALKIVERQESVPDASMCECTAQSCVACKLIIPLFLPFSLFYNCRAKLGIILRTRPVPARRSMIFGTIKNNSFLPAWAFVTCN